jgi:predicted tellurium resistance membrane protein TerC
MSDHQHPSDRKAAYTGLIFAVITLAILLYAIVFLTNRHYEGREGAKPASGSTQ